MANVATAGRGADGSPDADAMGGPNMNAAEGTVENGFVVVVARSLVVVVGSGEDDELVVAIEVELVAGVARASGASFSEGVRAPPTIRTKKDPPINQPACPRVAIPSRPVGRTRLNKPNRRPPRPKRLSHVPIVI